MKLFIARIYARRVVRALILASFLPASVALSGQTTTNIQLTNTVLQASPARLGVNLGDQDYWDSGQIMKNLVWRNPGFEGQKFRSILKCAAVTANTCTDDNNWSGQPTGFWKGGTYLILSGAQAGKTGLVVQSTKNPSSCGGCGQIVQFDQSIGAAVGDYFVVSNSMPGAGDTGWWDSVSGGGTITSETNDISPNSPGKQALVLNASASGQSAGVASYFDTFTGISFIQMNGNFEVTFRAKGVGGNNQLNIVSQRFGGAVFLNKTLTLTNTWQDYTLTFSATENGSAVGNVVLSFTAAGSNVELDDVSLDQTNSDANNPTAYRDDVVNALKELNPGVIRMMASGAALGSDLINQIQPPFARYRMGFNSGHTTAEDVAYGIHEFLQLCQTVNADPWITIPTATTQAEMSAFMQYLMGDGSDQYSSLRISRGQSAPWTSVFNKIHIELGNETWNGSFKGESMAYPAYPQLANKTFGTIRSTPGFVANKFDLVIDGWSSVPGYNQGILATSTQHDSIDIAPYLLYQMNDEAAANQFGALLAEPELWDTANGGGQVFADMAVANAAPTKTNLNVYETNLGPMIGTVTQAQIDALTPSVGAGLAHAEHMLLMMKLGVKYQNTFALPQYKYSDTSATNRPLVPMWGIVVDMGTTNRRRPQFLTQALANSVISGNMVQTVHTGADPTWNQSATSDSVVLKNAHDLQSFAFVNGSTSSVVVFNLSQKLSLPVTLSGPNAPSGSVTMSQITSGNITDNNETANNVQTVTKTLSGFDPNAGLTLPPFSMTVLTSNANVAATQSPSFSVAAGTYTSSQTVALSDGTAGATIYYTTDGSAPSTSSTQYTTPITVSASETISAIAVAANLSASPVVSATYVISAPTAAATPVFSLAAGSFSTTQSVVITDATTGASIYYTTDGTVPTTSSAKYAGAITVSATETLNAIATATNYTTSAVATATYTITPVTQSVAAPVLSLPSGTYPAAQTVAIVSTTSGATIHYTIDGSTPTTSSPAYTSALTVNSTAVVKAMATKPQFTPSPVVSASYTIAPVTQKTAMPVVSVAPGTYSSPQTVSLSDATPGAVIYFTVQTAKKYTSVATYKAPIVLTENATIHSYALAPSYKKSQGIVATYIIDGGSPEPPTATPAFSVAPGTYATQQTVTITDTTVGAAIYYTKDGSVPTTTSTLYTGPITVSASTVIKAIAVAPNFTASGETDAAYVIGPVAGPAVFAPGVMTLRGSAALFGTSLRLTNGSEGEIAAAWSTKRVAVSSFDAQFTFELSKSTADGFTFTLQNSGKGNWASGGNGDALGYQGISNSVAIKFNLYDNSTKKEVSTTGLLTNGAAQTVMSVDMSTAKIDLHSGHPFTVHLSYDGKVLTQTVTDTVTQAVFTHSYKVAVPTLLGSGTAYAGFTGSTGGYTAIQDILNFGYLGK